MPKEKKEILPYKIDRGLFNKTTMIMDFLSQKGNSRFFHGGF
jgi:hypothetical protein